MDVGFDKRRLQRTDQTRENCYRPGSVANGTVSKERLDQPLLPPGVYWRDALSDAINARRGCR